MIEEILSSILAARFVLTSWMFLDPRRRRTQRLGVAVAAYIYES